MRKLEELRTQIRQTDMHIIESLAKRQELAKQIGQIKLAEKKEIVDLAQEKRLFEFYEQLSEQCHLQKTFVKRLFKLIIAYSRSVQKL
ncbi:chorismate mutase [Legionella sp. D16C41]|uniref:chorismate mutase n=1 Tax=Legionella sp. D16C41 TaxID=3402688 RepID=UPI003AF7C528